MNINTFKELKYVLAFEKKLYFGEDSILKHFLFSSNTWYIWKYQKQLRKCEYYYTAKTYKKFYKLLLLIGRRKKNIIGRKVGLEIAEDSIDIGLRIYHSNVVINPNSKIGKNCIIVGNLCIGNNAGVEKAAELGDNIVLGYGASIIGNIKIADNVKIGAGAVIVKDILEKGKVVVGIPGREIKR